MPRIFDVEQNSEAWFEMRKGVITATRAAALLKRTRNGFATSRQHYTHKIAFERMNAIAPPRGAEGPQQRRGHEFEAEAAMVYEFEKGLTTQLCGFMLHDKHDVFGCSPDRLVGDDGLLEIKVPTAVEKHVDCLRNKSHAEEYAGQILHQLYVSGRDWVDLVSYNDGAPPNLQLAVHRLNRPDSWDEYETLLMAADNEIEDVIIELKKIQTQAIAA